MAMEEDLTATFAKQEGLSPESVMAFAGSSEPLHYTVLAFTGKDKPLVVADPGYEAPMWAAQELPARKSSRCRWPIPRARPRTTSRPCSPLRRIPA